VDRLESARSPVRSPAQGRRSMDERKIQEGVLNKADSILDEIADFIFSKSQEIIVAKGAVDEGTLLKSGNVTRKFLEKEVVYTAPYAAFVEFGTDPHMPPVGPLIDWSRRKLGLNEQEAKKTAWAIAKKIAKEGTEPVSFMRSAVEEARAKYKGVKISGA